MRDPRLSRTRHGDGLFALDMSSNLTHCSEYTTLLRMHPLHCFCCEVEAALLSPFSLHARSCATLPMLLVLVVVLFLSIVTSIVVSCLLNVVICIVKCRPGILLIHSYSPVSVIQFMLLLKLTDHMFPVKLVIGSQVSSFSRGKSRHPMRNSGPFFVIRLSFTSRTKNSVCLLFDFSKGFLQARRGLRLLNHRFPTRIRDRLGLFSCFTPSHTPFPGR